MNVGASSNIHQSITFFFPGLEVGRGLGVPGGREGEEEKGVWALFTFFQSAEQLVSLR